MFTQWYSLLRHADTVSIMLWTADGSEILDYSGNLTQPLEWAKYMGNPNTEHEVGLGPKNYRCTKEPTCTSKTRRHLLMAI